MAFSDLNDYGPEKNQTYRYILVLIDSFSKFGWCNHLERKIAKTIKDFFEKKIDFSSKKPDLIES